MNGILAYYITLISSSSVSAIHGFIPTLLAAEEDFINIGRLKAAGFLLLLVIGAGIVLFVYTTLRKNMNRSRELRKKAGRTTFFERKVTADKEITTDKIENSQYRIFDHYPTPTAVCLPNGMICYVNSGFAKAFGSVKANMENLLVLNILPSELAASLDPIFRDKSMDVFESPSVFYTSATGTSYKVRVTRSRPGDPDCVMYLTLHSIHGSELRSITDPESGRDVLIQILDRAPYPVFIEGMDGRILDVNSAACTLQGMKRDELIGKVIDELSPVNFKREISNQKVAIDDSHRNIDFMSIIYDRKGHPVPVRIYVSGINYFGSSALVFVIVDLTKTIERNKELDEYKIKAEESDRLKSSFLANLSHEVRTPMNSIMGFSELLAEPGVSDKERKEFIKLIRQSGKELLTQINNIIDFSKIEAGLIQLKSDICNFEPLFHQLHEFWLEECPNQDDIKLFFELPQNIIRNGIATDRVRLKQILKVLLANSIKFTKKGVIEIGVRMKAPQLYEFYVRDTGIGIPENKHREIFEQFRQVDDSNEREFSGMGVGLSIASRLIQFLGGHQWVVSEPGKGSEFRFVLPDLLHPQGSPFLQVSSGPLSMINKLMVVSPTEEIYTELSQNSRPINFQVMWAQNTEEMKAMLLSNKVRFMLLALDQLPLWQELLPKIREVSRDLKLIGITKNLDTQRREKLMSMGLNEVIRTAVNIPIILNIMERRDLGSMNILSTTFHKN